MRPPLCPDFLLYGTCRRRFVSRPLWCSIRVKMLCATVHLHMDQKRQDRKRRVVEESITRKRSTQGSAVLMS